MHNLQHDLLAAFRAWDGFRMNPATMSVELGAQQNISLRRSDRFRRATGTRTHALLSETEGNKWLEQYARGDREQVWAEILDLGPAVRDPNFLRFAACGFPGGPGRSLVSN